MTVEPLFAIAIWVFVALVLAGALSAFDIQMYKVYNEDSHFCFLNKYPWETLVVLWPMALVAMPAFGLCLLTYKTSKYVALGISNLFKKKEF